MRDQRASTDAAHENVRGGLGGGPALEAAVMRLHAGAALRGQRAATADGGAAHKRAILQAQPTPCAEDAAGVQRVAGEPFRKHDGLHREVCSGPLEHQVKTVSAGTSHAHSSIAPAS